MEEQRLEEFEFYDEKDGSGQKIARVKRVPKLDGEKLGEIIINTISTKNEYRQLIVFWSAISVSWYCEFRTEIVPLEQTWLEERKKVIYPVSLEYKNERYWIIKRNKGPDNNKWMLEVGKIKKIIQKALEAKEKQEPGFFSVGK